MIDPNTTKEKIRIEDLLAVKKAEKPDDEFWERFDGELHQRMLQTLVRKEPWYSQVARACCGRIAQRLAIASSVALIALAVVRPAFFVMGFEKMPEEASAVAERDRLNGATVPQVDTTTESKSDKGLLEASLANLDAAVATADYQIERISSSISEAGVTYRKEFAMDALPVTSAEVADYSSDRAAAWATFGNTGVASLVY